MTDQSITSEDRARLLDKIKKCLALSASHEPHEAAAAMRQAQKLMDKLGVTAEEVEGPLIESTTVKTREGFGRCVYMSHLGHLIDRVFGVKHVLEQNPGSANRLNVRYVGPAGRVQLAEYTHRVLQRAMDHAWAAHLRLWPEHKSDGGKRQSFRLGWLGEVQQQVEALAPSALEERAIEAWMGRYYGRELEVQATRKSKLDPHAAHAGRAAARDFRLHRPMANEKLKLEHKK